MWRYTSWRSPRGERIAALASGGVASQRAGRLFGEAKELTAALYCCPTGAAKKNGIFGRANPKLAEAPRIGFCQTCEMDG